jgi:hypothetical protein
MPSTTNQGATDIIANYLQGLNLQVALYKYDTTSGSPTTWQAGFTELSGSGYARATLTLTNAVTSAGVGIKTSNQADLTFGPASGDWATGTMKICGYQIFDAGSGRSVWRGVFSAMQQLNVVNGQPYEIKAGSLTHTILTDDA